VAPRFFVELVFCYTWIFLKENFKFTPFLVKFTPDGRGGADTLKFNLHIIGRAKKGCEFNQKRCEFKILLFK